MTKQQRRQKQQDEEGKGKKAFRQASFSKLLKENTGAAI
jgi:hypothetical protein